MQRQEAVGKGSGFEFHESGSSLLFGTCSLMKKNPLSRKKHTGAVSATPYDRMKEEAEKGERLLKVRARF